MGFRCSLVEGKQYEDRDQDYSLRSSSSDWSSTSCLTSSATPFHSGGQIWLYSQQVGPLVQWEGYLKSGISGYISIFYLDQANQSLDILNQKTTFNQILNPILFA